MPHTTANSAHRRRRETVHTANTPANAASLQVLAVDLLNPTPQAEARKHKLKVCIANAQGHTTHLLTV